jgi:hypothetical protein
MKNKIQLESEKIMILMLIINGITAAIALFILGDMFRMTMTIAITILTLFVGSKLKIEKIEK